MKENITTKNNTEGEILGVAGGNYRIIISGEETNGNYAVIEMFVPPGGGPLPHSHPGTQELFFLIEGELEFKTEAGKQIVNEGGFINIPFEGDIHCFKNISDKLAKLLCTVIPAGLENVFRELGAAAQYGQFLPVAKNTPEHLTLIQEVDKKYGLTTYAQDFFE
jgi:quercetin dioxygenase-like cupin family protein